jgi:hypothetical protein
VKNIEILLQRVRSDIVEDSTVIFDPLIEGLLVHDKEHDRAPVDIVTGDQRTRILTPRFPTTDL